MTSRFWRAVCPRFTPGLAVMARRFFSVHARHCDSIAAFCLGSRPALRLWRSVLPSVCARPLQFYCSVLPQFARPALRLWRSVLPRFARWACGFGGALPSVCALGLQLWRALCLGSRSALRFCRRVLPRFAPGLAALLRCFAFVHACLFSLVRKKEAACGILRSCSAGSRSPFVRSRCVSAVIGRSEFTSGLAVYLWRSRRSYRGRRGTRNGATRAGGADFVRLCASTLALQCFPRGVRWGCAPQTAPKSLRLSGLSSRCGGVMLVRIRAVTRAHGKT